MEFMERAAVELVCRYHPELIIPLPDKAAAFLLVEVDGNHEDLLVQDCASISTVVEAFGAGEISFAESTQKRQSCGAFADLPANRSKGTLCTRRKIPLYPVPNFPPVGECEVHWPCLWL